MNGIGLGAGVSRDGMFQKGGWFKITATNEGATEKNALYPAKEAVETQSITRNIKKAIC